MLFASCAMANEPGPIEASGAAPVIVPYLNKTISEVKQDGYSSADHGLAEETGEDGKEAGQDPDHAYDAVLTRAGIYDAGGVEEAQREPLPELVGAGAGEGGIENADDAGEGYLAFAADNGPEGIPGTEGVFTEGQEADPQDYPVQEERAVCLGEWTVTAYCPCEICCGQWATGCTASGALAVPEHTVACGILPFGTRIVIDDEIYTVEDTGVEGEWVDIFFASHEEALAYGMQIKEVYLYE